MPITARRNGNRVLSRLSLRDFGLLEPHLEAVELPAVMQLEVSHTSIDWIYFLTAGVASVVADSPSKRPIEIGIIGREGMTGLAVVLGQQRARHTTYIQVAGSGWRLESERLRQALGQSVGLHRSLLQYVHDFLTQTTETALSNGRSKTDQRLARWLLMADDRIDGCRLPLTHALLAIMLGVQRPAVTVAIKALEGAGLISSERGVIIVLDRVGLEVLTDGAYTRPELL